MKAMFWRLAALCSITALGACADESAGPSGPGIEVEVAPLSLPGVQGVHYALAVLNVDPGNTNIFTNGGVVVAAHSAKVVWQEDTVTSNQYGNDDGGDISYVGPCDADTPALQNNDNWVAVAIMQVAVGNNNGSLSGTAPTTPAVNNAIFVGTYNILDDEVTVANTNPLENPQDPDFVNPCNYNDACVLKFPCVENQDTLVVFNLTIMRDAEQGFFDIAVNFEDVFCSAKFETCYDVVTTGVAVYTECNGAFFYTFTDDKQVTRYAAWNGTAWIAYESPCSSAGINISLQGVAPPPPPGAPGSLSVFGSGQVIGTWTPVTTPTQTGGTPINLLHGQTEGDPREHTAVVGLACTAGPDGPAPIGNITTQLLMTNPVVTCTAPGPIAQFVIDLSGPNGTQGNHRMPATGSPSIEYSLFFGNEELNCGTSTIFVHHIDTASIPPKYYYGADGDYYAVYNSGNGTWTLHRTSDNSIVIDPANSLPVTSTGAGVPASFIWGISPNGTTTVTPHMIQVPGSPYSCNKVYYNLAFNIQHLADQGLTNCTFKYVATAIEQGTLGPLPNTFSTSGNLNDPNAQYGAIVFGKPNPAQPGLPLTTGVVSGTPPKSGKSCNSHQLGATNSDVNAGYIKGSGFVSPSGNFPSPGFNFQSTGGPAGALDPP